MQPKKYLLFILVPLYLLLSPCISRADDDPVKKIIGQLTKWVKTAPQEKVYLHMDKPYYAAGEDIWFKAYITSGPAHTLSKLGDVLNVELVNSRDSVKRSLKFSVLNGLCQGDFRLPASLPAGNYRIRAYTPYMRNAGDKYFFDKTFFVAGVVSPQVANTVVKEIAGKTDVQFFPEGGALVNGLNSKIAFKATGTNGLGTDISGVIKDDEGSEITKLGTAHFGMGYTSFTPQKGRSYKAIINLPGEPERTITLPAAAESGYNLNITNSNSTDISVKIGISRDIVAKANGNLILIAQQNGQVYYSAQARADKNTIVTSMPESDFPTGIVQFTLFADGNQPVAERLVFIQNPDQLKLTVTTDKPVYAPRQKVNINLDGLSPANKPIVGVFSASVIDEGKVFSDESAEITILSSLLLTSDLAGYIEKPNYYFNNPTDKTKAELDALMMTQGYRRFIWKQLLDDSTAPQLYQPERSLTISGTVKTTGGKMVPKATVTLLSTTNGLIVRDTIAGDDGRFAFHNLRFKDSTRFVVQGRTAKGGEYVEVKLDNSMPTIADSNKNKPDMLPGMTEVMNAYWANSQAQKNEWQKYGLNDGITVLKEVIIKQKKKNPLAEHSANLNGGGNANQVIKASQLTICTQLASCLNGMLSGVEFVNDTAYLSRTSKGFVTARLPMLIVVDGMEMPGNYNLNDLNAGDVETIESLRSPDLVGVYGIKGSSGVLVVTTKRGDTNQIDKSPPGVAVQVPVGFTAVREFYAPKYDDPKALTKAADLRSTICWKPDILTDATGHASFSFFNADAKGTYRVTIEGIDANGHLGRQVYRYKVE